MTSRPAMPANESGQIEVAVRERYTSAALEREGALCCPVDYDPRYLEVIPQAVLERDYGCGDPSAWVKEGDVVLDLGSGGGKICFIAAQIVGPEGKVIGVDMNSEMLALARRAAPAVAARIGYANVEFKRGQIQDLGVDHDLLESWLTHNPVKTTRDLARLESTRDRLRRDAPLIPDASVDVVVSNCVLNLVRWQDRNQLAREVFRVVKPGGRIAISDIVSDRPVPEHLQQDPALWSGCVSGAFEESRFLQCLEEAGFRAIKIARWESEPFATVEGIEFRSVTVTALKTESGPCAENSKEVIYRGPWKRVEDDEGHVFERGQRVAVCGRTRETLASEPYARDVIAVGVQDSSDVGCC